MPVYRWLVVTCLCVRLWCTSCSAWLPSSRPSLLLSPIPCWAGRSSSCSACLMEWCSPTSSPLTSRPLGTPPSSEPLYWWAWWCRTGSSDTLIPSTQVKAKTSEARLDRFSFAVVLPKFTIHVGNPEIDDVLKMLLGNPNMVGAIMSCFLDNTVPGKWHSWYL